MSIKAYGPITSAPSSDSLQLLFELPSANMQSTADQQFTRVFNGTNYVVTMVFARQRSGAIGVSCIGGIYTGASKTGDQLVSALQSWIGLGATGIVNATLGGVVGTNLETATPYLSLTTGSLSALSATLFICGFDIS